MSLNPVPLELYQTIDPRVNVNSKRGYTALRGGMVNSWQQFPATTINNSQVQITCNPPSQDIVINRKVYLKFNATLDFTGTGNPLLQIGANDAPRAYPLSQIINALQFTINNDTLTLAPFYQYWPSLLWYHNTYNDRYKHYSTTPTMLDQQQNYSDIKGQGNRNPLGQYQTNSYETARGAFPMTVVTNGNGTAQVVLEVTEPMYISPLVFGSEDESGLVGVQNMTFTATFGNLQRLWSHNQTNGNPLSALNVTVNSASLLFEYITPNPISPIPKQVSYPYFSIVSYPTKGSSSFAKSSGTTFSSGSLSMNSVQLTSIPRRMYIYARYDDSLTQNPTVSASTGPCLSDSYLALGSPNPLTVTWNNNQFLSQATHQDLYLMSVKNGLQMSFPQFEGVMDNLPGTNSGVSTGVGAILCVDFGTDIGLNPSEAPGLLGNYQLGLTCNFKNINSQLDITPTLYVVVVYEGSFNVINGTCNHQIGVLTKEDVLKSMNAPMYSYKLAENIFGGDFFSSIKKFVGNVASGVKKAVPAVRRALPYVQKGLDVAKQFGLGGARAGAYGMGEGVMSGGRRKVVRRRGRGMDGGILVGAGLMTREQLKEKLRKHQEDENIDETNEEGGDGCCGSSSEKSDSE